MYVCVCIYIYIYIYIIYVSNPRVGFALEDNLREARSSREGLDLAFWINNDDDNHNNNNIDRYLWKARGLDLAFWIRCFCANRMTGR